MSNLRIMKSGIYNGILKGHMQVIHNVAQPELANRPQRPFYLPFARRLPPAILVNPHMVNCWRAFELHMAELNLAAIGMGFCGAVKFPGLCPGVCPTY